MMMTCFCDMVSQWKIFSLISSRDYCKRSSPSQIFDTSQVGFAPAQNLSSGLVKWSCAVVATATPRLHAVIATQSLQLFKHVELTEFVKQNDKLFLLTCLTNFELVALMMM